MPDYTKQTPSKYDFVRSGHILERRFEIIKNFIEKFIKESSTSKRRPITISEMGCGPGRLGYLIANCFKNYQINAYDINEKFIKYAKKNFLRENLSYRVLDIEKSKLSEPVDILITTDILHHLNDLNLAIGNIGSSINKNGVWIALEHNIYNIYIFLFQLLTKDESLFFQSRTEKLFSKHFQVLEKRYALLIHSKIKKPPKWLKYLEKKIENNKFLGGSIIYFLKKI